ncbi:MAG: hypothetical protein HEQ23_08170 [Tepidisphaera sp.]
MPDPPRNKIWRTPILWIAGTVLVLSLCCSSLSLLGFFGVMADVGPDENRQMGFQILRLTAIPLILSAAAPAIALTLGRSRPK